MRKNPRIEAPPVGREPRNPVMVLVLGWYLLLIGATALLVMAMVPGARNEVVVMAEIVATGVGDDEQVVAAWPDHNGEPWETVLTPRRPEEVSEGSTVKIRFDPEAREFVYTYDSRFHESKPTGRIVFAGLVFAFVAPLLLAWSVRLARWALGTRSSPQPVAVTVLVATPVSGSFGDPGPAALWLRLRFPDGTIWYQRAIWSRRLMARALRQEASDRPRVFGSGDADGAIAASARRCPGEGLMCLIDVPGVGRIWPAGVARRREPSSYRLDGVDPARLGEEFRGGAASVVQLVLGVILVGMTWAYSGSIVVAATVPVAIGSAWLLLGATPGRGLYTHHRLYREPEAAA